MTSESQHAGDYPHLHHVKVIGQQTNLLDAVRKAVEPHAPHLHDNDFVMRSSSQGNYCAVTISLEVQHEAQLLAIYTAVKAVDGVILCL
ncbi:DUF493 domain-containing protein [Acidithiobacillus marinus]|uniref:DUF493 domain-containing protein n=1 Tax=Acidithiobacillus marinus TaxID=187490 RepID=A0A2I1DL64_9PROT|nr:DUF493 domain-containing protein [Acidithiobacillus marinus]PKY10619.1 DUF493 domain-containing protein [Acidithiobacillus marinus]